MAKSREELALELRLSEERFRTFMNNAPFITFVKDGEGHYLYYNERMATRFGIDQDEWIGRTDNELWPEAIARDIRLNDLEVIESGKSIERLEETIDAAGELTTWKIHKFAWNDELGQVRLGGIGLDLSDELARERALAEANEKLQKLATIDALTGLANRRVLDEQVDYEFRIAGRNHSRLSVVMLDIDDFKRCNDVFGHAAGDQVLHLLGALITSNLRITDTAARYGGEEFVILLPGTGLDGSRIFAERLREKMRETVWGHEPVTASFGTASLEPGVTSGNQLIDLADRAMYEAKRTGKNRIVDFSELPAAASGTPG